MANTFVYTVLLMVITGVTMYLVYGRSGRMKASAAAPTVAGAKKEAPLLVP